LRFQLIEPVGIDPDTAEPLYRLTPAVVARCAS
jgi:hypothetical protein